MSSARLGDAIAALHTLFTASAALAGVTVTRYPAPTLIPDPQFIIVGHDGSLDAGGALLGATESGTHTTVFVAMGTPPQLQQETGQVRVVAVAQSGETENLAGQVTAAQALLSACADACAGQQSGDILFDTTTSGRLVTRQYAQGCAAVWAFTVGYSAPW